MSPLVENLNQDRVASIKQTERNSGKEILGEGDFFDFFDKTYLPAYIEHLPEYYPQGVEAAKQIPQVLEELLPVLLSSSGIGKTELISGVAQNISYFYLTERIFGEGKLPRWHWDFRPQFAHKAKTLAADGSQREAMRFMESLASDPDIDMKWGMKEATMSEIVKGFRKQISKKKKYQLTQLDDEATTKDVKTQMEYKGVAFDILYSDRVRVRVIGGPLPHNNRIDVLSLWIYDRGGEVVRKGQCVEYGKRLYHFEARNIPETAEAMDYDLRGGTTFKGQDQGAIPLYVANDRLRFALPVDAVASLYGQDEIIIKPYDINPQDPRSVQEALVSETIVRMGRIRLCFDLGLTTIYDEQGNFVDVLETPQFDYLWPRLLNMFDLRKRIRELSIYTIGLRPERLVQFQQELAMMFYADPWETLNFIQHSGLYKLIPGWKNKTWVDIENMKAASSMVVEPMQGVEGLRLVEKQDTAFQREQRDLYVSGNQIDGLERVMRADGATEGEEIFWFLNLFTSIEKMARIEEVAEDVVPADQKPYHAITISSPDGEPFHGLLTGNRQLSSRERAILGRRLLGVTSFRPDILSFALSQRQLAIEACNGTVLEAQIDAVGNIPERSEFHKMLLQQQEDLSLLISILYFYPFLTPRELEDTFFLLVPDSEDKILLKKHNFHYMIFDLMATGLVERHTYKRLEQSTGQIVDVEFLALRSSSAMHQWEVLEKINGFMNFWLSHRVNDHLTVEEAQARYYHLYQLLVQYKIPTFEVLKTMSAEDWMILRKRLAFLGESIIENEYIQAQMESQDLLQVTEEYLLMQR